MKTDDELRALAKKLADEILSEVAGEFEIDDTNNLADKLLAFHKEASAEMARDAERYRWLRGNGAIISREAGIPVHKASFGIGLDAAIDAAKEGGDE